MLKLSIIVPVYNVSKYLAKCLDSLLAQDLKSEEYEIIVVNDGSTDNSSEITAEYAEKYSNIVLINQENQGLSGARNSGIKIAKGEYIQFVDSDDFLEPNVLKTLVDKMDNDKLDILRFNYQNVNENYEVYEPYKEHKPFVDYRDEICDGLTFLTERLGYACYAVQFIIKSDLLKKDGNLFKIGIYFEDTEWTPRILVQANRITSTDKMVYNYLLRDGSITKSVDIEKKKKIIDDKLLVIDFLKQTSFSISDKRWFDGMVSASVVAILNNVAINFYDKRDYYINQLKHRKLFPLYTYHLSKHLIRKVKLINISPKLFCFLLHLKNC